MKVLASLSLAAACAVGASAGITLQGPTTLPLSPLVNPTHAAVGDVDANGVVDVIVSCRDTTGQLAFLRGIGGGVFAAPEFIAVGAPTDWVEVRELTGDGIPDLLAAVRSNHGRLALLPGLGGGLFGEPRMFLAQRNPSKVVLSDFDADGDLDAALVNYGSGSVEVWKWTSTGDFQQSQIIATQPWATAIPYPFCIVAADFDGDGDRDLATASTGGAAIAVMRNNGAGLFAQGESWHVPTVAKESVAISNIVEADIDLDGDLDILSNGLLLNSPNVTVVWVNDGAGAFGETILRVGGIEGYSWTVNSADMDGDGDRDVLMGSALPGKLTIAEVSGSTGGEFVHVTAKAAGTFLRDMTLVDIDSDADPDVVAVDIAAHTVMIYRNTSGGVAGDPPTGPPQDSVPIFVSASAASQWLAQWQDDTASFGNAVPPACGAGGGLCEEPHETPGCVRTLCCQAVCEFNPVCCEVSWDQSCVDAEDELCDDYNCPSAGACDAFHAGPGCENESCCTFLCTFDAFCCYAIWDEVCAREAAALCGASPCSIGHDPSAIELVEICYERIDEGCNKVGDTATVVACGAKYESTISTESTRDTDWFRLDALGCRADLTITSEFPLLALVLRGACEGPLQLVQSFEVPSCTARSVTLAGANDWLVIAAATNDRPFRSAFPCDVDDPDAPPPDPADPPERPSFFGLHYRVSFAQHLVPGDINGDGTVNGSDLASLLSGWGGAGAADLDGSGVVDGSDLATLLSHWGAN